MGATTVWERWDSMLPDGSINPGEMTSFNHYALGAVADWMHRTIGGLTPTEPGYRHMEIRPRPGGGLTHAQARHITPYGMAECSWKIEDGKIHLNVIIPPNTTALVTFPGGDMAPVEVGSGIWHWSVEYQDPDARGPFSVDDLTGDIISEPAANSALTEVLAQVDMPEFLRAVIIGELNVPLRQSLRMLPNYEHAVKLMKDALADL
jgi:alpha-L-rhamnosidase